MPSLDRNDPLQKKYRRLFWLLLAAITLLRLVMAGRFGLGVDESHYLMYSRRLAWGYLDHPPLVAFLAALTTLAGRGIFFIRLGPIICSTGSLVLLRYLVLALYADERLALWSLALMLLLPYEHLLGVALLPDATLNLFWCGTLLALWYAVQNGRWATWLLVGLLFGGALLSKYHAVLLPVCLFCYLATSPKRRFWLGRLKPYVALLTGLAVFVPNLVWNGRHGWISYWFQLHHGARGHFSPAKVLAVLGGQLAVWSPIIFALLMVAFIVIARQKPLRESDRFVLWTSLPVFVFFCSIGSFGKMLPHWPAVGWWTGSLAVTRVVLQKAVQGSKAGRRWRRWSIAAAATGFAMTAVLYVGLLVPFVHPLYSRVRQITMEINRYLPGMKPLKPFQAKDDITNEIFGWDRVGARLEAIRAAMPHPQKTFVFAHKFYTISQLAVYLKADTVSTTLGHKIDQYHLWFSPREHAGWDALFVDDNRWFRGPGRFAHLFGHIDAQPVVIKVWRNGQLAHEMRVYRCYDFKGRF